MLVALRVRLPDRPGALGLVASRIGSVRGDVLAIEILETGQGSVVDEFVIRLDDPGVIDLMVNEINAVDGALVEDRRTVEGERIDTGLGALTAAVRCVRARPERRLEVLCDEMVSRCGAAWVMVLDAIDGTVVSAVGPHPEEFAHLGSDPDHTVEVHLANHGVRLVLGQPSRRILDRDRLRVELLAELVDALGGSGPGA